MFILKGPLRNSKDMRKYTCKTCDHSFKDVSNHKAMDHLFLREGADVKLCIDPQLSAAEFRKASVNTIKAADGFEERLNKHIAMGRITQQQPTLKSEIGRAISEQEMHALHLEQVRSSLSKGEFNVHKD